MQAMQAELDRLGTVLKARKTPVVTLPSWDELCADYQPIKPAIRAHASGARFLAILAGVQSGKTYMAAREFLKRILGDRKKKTGPLQYWAVAPIFPLTRRQESVLRRVVTGTLLASENRTERIFFLKGDITIQFKSADHPDTLVSEPVDGMWIDEAARLKPEAWSDGLEGRMTATNGWAIFTTSSKGRNWFYQEILARAERLEPGFDWITWRTEENTAVPGIAEEIARKRATLPRKIFQREYEASLDAFAGQIYEEWERALHILGPSNRVPDLQRLDWQPKEINEIIYGVDPGFRTAVMLCVARVGNRWLVLDERAGSGWSEPDYQKHAAELTEKWGVGTWLVDPSAPSVVKALRAKGIRARGADNDVAAGILRVATLMHPNGDNGPLIAIHPRCKMLIEQLPTYQWNGDTEKPVKEDDHAPDALRYAVYNRSTAEVTT